METTNNNTFNDINELDDLRRQINDLKEKVNKQGYLNESLIKHTIKSKMKGVHRKIMMLAVTAMFCIPLYIWMKYENNLSWALVVFTIVMMLGSIISDYFINRIDVTHMGDDMIETARKLTQMKKNRAIAHRVGMGVAMVWFIWFLYEFYHSQLGHGIQMAWMSIIPIVVGAGIGCIGGIQIYRKMQRANDEMIEQINELTREQ